MSTKFFNVRVKGKSNYFTDKLVAKQFRDKNAGTIVVRGPDHMGYHGNRCPKRNNK